MFRPRSLLHKCAFALLFFAARAATAQVYEISGGTSSLYQASGGQVALHASSYDLTLGAGVEMGHFLYGGHIVKQIGATRWTAGDERIDFSLPTDVFGGGSHFLYARGIGVRTHAGPASITAFAGAISDFYQTPLFEGADWGEGMAYLATKQQVAPAWTIETHALASNTMTAIASLEWKPSERTALAFSSGLGADAPYNAVSLNLKRPWGDVTASYIAMGQSFRRVVVTSLVDAEPYKDNLSITLRPTRWLSLNGGTQNFLVPVQQTSGLSVSGTGAWQNLTSSTTNGSFNMQVAGLSLSGSAYRSKAEDPSGNQTGNHATDFSVARDITSWIRANASYMVSKPQNMPGQSSVFATLTERLNPRLSLNQSVNSSNGQTSVLYGGELTTNLLSISANYESFYVPLQTGKPFQESLLLDVALHLFGRADLHGATFVGPTGKLLYTADAHALSSHEGALPGVVPSVPFGNYLLRATVVDDAQNPVEGAALVIDDKTYYTNSDGGFVMHEKRARTHSLRVECPRFLADGHWQIVSSPQSIASSNTQSVGVIIVVRRVEHAEPGGIE